MAPALTALCTAVHVQRTGCRLLEAKSVAIGRLMEIVPYGTMDPSPNLYDTTLYSMGGVLLVAFGVASALHPANEK